MILGFIFGFDDGRPSFNISLYLMDIIKFIIISLAMLYLYTKIQEFFAKKNGAIAKLTLWNAKGFKIPFGKQRRTLPLWIIIPIIISLISKGQLYFAGILTTEITEIQKYRLGRKYKKLTEFERAKILVSAPLILSAISLVSFPFIKDFSLVASMIAVFSMLPLPKLAGADIFFGSKPSYIISTTFILAVAIFIKLLSPLAAMLIAMIIASVAVITYSYIFYKKR